MGKDRLKPNYQAVAKLIKVRSPHAQIALFCCKGPKHDDNDLLKVPSSIMTFKYHKLQSEKVFLQDYWNDLQELQAYFP